MGNLKSIICSAIAEKRLLQVSYKGKMQIGGALPAVSKRGGERHPPLLAGRGCMRGNTASRLVHTLYVTNGKRERSPWTGF